MRKGKWGGGTTASFRQATFLFAWSDPAISKLDVEDDLKISVVKNILEANQRIAEENRQRFSASRVLVMNLMSSPGAGKTSLLERTIQNLKDKFRVGVIEGDIQSTYDAERIGRTGAPVVQINT